MKLTTRQLAETLVEATKEAQGQELDKIIADFIKFLHEHRQTNRIREVIKTIDYLWREKYGAANVTIHSAHPLSQGVKDKLEKLLQGAAIEEKVDKELIGGAKIRIDDKIIDGSIDGHLKDLKHQLSKIV